MSWIGPVDHYSYSSLESNLVGHCSYKSWRETQWITVAIGGGERPKGHCCYKRWSEAQWITVAMRVGEVQWITIVLGVWRET